jgi:hypothetical protein
MSVAHINPLTFSSPNSISGCSLWLDANDPTTITMATGVSQWNDKSGNGYNLTQGTGGSQPTRTGNYLNFLSNYYLNLPAAAINNASTFSLFLIFNPIASINWIIQKQTNGVSTMNMLSMTNYWQNNTGSTAYVYWTSWANPGPFANSGTALALSTVQLLELVFDGTTLTIYRNGTVLSTTAGSFAIPNNTTPTNSTLGSWLPDGGIQNSGVTNFQMGELIYYNTTLSTAQRQNIEGYLAQKWSLKGSLPTFHPGIKSPLYPTLIRNRILNKPKTGVFYPTSIAGCQVWLDASDPTLFSYSSGSVIQQWNDKSGNSLHAYSNSVIGWQAPSYVSGNPSYVSLQPNQALYVPNFPYTTAWSVFSCMNNVSLGARWYISPYSDLSIVLMGMSQPGNKVWAGILAGDGDITGSHVEYTSAQNTNGTGIYSYFRDGTQISINTIGNSVGAATVRMGIGANGANYYDIGGTYYPYEIIFYNQYLGSNDRQTVEGYLAWKWGLQSQLDASNPYKSAAPGSTSRLPMPPILNRKRIFL